jgi:hypothetical protein
LAKTFICGRPTPESGMGEPTASLSGVIICAVALSADSAVGSNTSAGAAPPTNLKCAGADIVNAGIAEAATCISIGRSR